MRFKTNELTFERLYEAAGRRIRNISDVFDWAFTDLGKQNKSALESFRGCHHGERCFLVANGPSIATMDLTPLRNEVTIGLNRIYLIFDRLGFLPTYYGASNELILEQFHGDIAGLEMPKFLGWHRRHLFQKGFDTIIANTCYLRDKLSVNDTFCTDVTGGITSGGTVTYHMLQLAYFMGFREVVIVGLDHSFKGSGTPNRVEVRIGRDENHFHPEYWPEGSKWQLPDLFRTDLAYKNARTAFELDGRRILDATLGGKCDVFQKVNFRDVIGADVGEVTA